MNKPKDRTPLQAQRPASADSTCVKDELARLRQHFTDPREREIDGVAAIGPHGSVRDAIRRLVTLERRDAAQTTCAAVPSGAQGPPWLKDLVAQAEKLYLLLPTIDRPTGLHERHGAAVFLYRLADSCQRAAHELLLHSPLKVPHLDVLSQMHRARADLVPASAAGSWRLDSDSEDTWRADDQTVHRCTEHGWLGCPEAGVRSLTDAGRLLVRDFRILGSIGCEGVFPRGAQPPAAHLSALVAHEELLQVLAPHRFDGEYPAAGLRRLLQTRNTTP